MPFYFFISLLLVSALLKPIVKKSRIPFSILLVLLGYFGSEITINLLNIDTSIRWDNFKIIIFYIFLPVLVFQSAININIKALKQNIIPIFIMVLPLMTLSTIVTAVCLYSGISHVEGLPWIAAFIAGALLSATDPESILEILKKSNSYERLCILLEGESLFNDAIAIVLFSIFIAIATNNQESTSWSMLLLHFSEVFFGGMMVGVVTGFIAYLIIKLIKKQQAFVLVSILPAYS